LELFWWQSLSQALLWSFPRFCCFALDSISSAEFFPHCFYRPHSIFIPVCSNYWETIVAQFLLGSFSYSVCYWDKFSQIFISLLFLFFPFCFWVMLGFELRNLCLLDNCSSLLFYFRIYLPDQSKFLCLKLRDISLSFICLPMTSLYHNLCFSGMPYNKDLLVPQIILIFFSWLRLRHLISKNKFLNKRLHILIHISLAISFIAGVMDRTNIGKFRVYNHLLKHLLVSGQEMGFG
jgi:hypothetical protein